MGPAEQNPYYIVYIFLLLLLYYLEGKSMVN